MVRNIFRVEYRETRELKMRVFAKLTKKESNRVSSEDNYYFFLRIIHLKKQKKRPLICSICEIELNFDSH